MDTVFKDRESMNLAANELMLSSRQFVLVATTERGIEVASSFEFEDASMGERLSALTHMKGALEEVGDGLTALAVKMLKEGLFE